MILIVEDSIDQQRLLLEMLESAGYNELKMLGNAPEALAYLEDKGDDVKLMIVDVWLAPGNGVELTRRVSTPRFADLPVIIMSGKEGPELLPQAIDAGANDFIFKPFHWLELVARVRHCLRLRDEVAQRVAREAELLASKRELEDAIRRLERLSSQDPLTGIANRRALDEHLDQEWRRAVRTKSHIAFILIDVDFFKDYNDYYGHLSGDQCLRKIATAIRGVVHRPADLVSRYGGEEFAIILPETPMAGARHIADAVRGAIEAMRLEHKKSKFEIVTASIGVVSIIPDRDAGSDKLVHAADRAMYRAKKEFRNCVIEFDQAVDGPL